MSTRVDATYGNLENWNYNFVTGFWLGFQSADTSIDPSQPSPSRQGYADGQIAGGGDGLKQGQAEASQRALALANTDVASRFRAIVDQAGAGPDLTIRVPDSQYSGGDGNPSVSGVEEKLKELASRFNLEVSGLYWVNGPFYLNYLGSGRELNLVQVYDGGIEHPYLFDEYHFTGNYGLENWLGQGLGGGFDFGMYQRLSGSQRYEFADIFQERFRDEVYQGYETVRTRPNDSANLLGLRYGLELGIAKYYQDGYLAGYRAAFKAAASQAYTQNFGANYAQDFKDRAAYFSQHPVLEITGLKVVNPENEGFYPGASLGITVDSIVNLGRVALSAQPTLDGIQVTSISGGSVVSLAASSSFKGPLSFGPLARIKDDVVVGQEIQIRFSLGESVFPLSLSVQWEAELGRFSKMAPGSPGFEASSQWILKQLTAEWLLAISTEVDPYPEHQSLLEQAVDYFESVGISDRENLIRITDAIYRVQEQGGGFHPILRHEYKQLASRIH